MEVFIHMKGTNIIPHLTKLLKNLIFKDFDLEFRITYKSNYYSGEYIITIYLDPEVMCMSGDKYIPESNIFLYELEENIYGVSPYVGLSDDNVIVKYKFLNEKEFSNKLRGMIQGILPELYNRIEDLPKLISIEVGQRFEMFEFKASFKFEEVPKMRKLSKFYEYIGELLPTFNDVYMDFGVDQIQMEKALTKFLTKMLSKKYPMYPDIQVSDANRFTPNKEICYDVFFLVIIDNYANDYLFHQNKFEEVKSYVKNLGKYMDINICGVYKEVVSQMEWDEMRIK